RGTAMSKPRTAALTSAETSIRRAIDDFTQAYNAGEFDRLSNIFAEDLVDMSAGGTARRGPGGQRDFVLRVGETHAKAKPHLEITVDEIQVAGEWAYERGSLEVTLTPIGGGEKSYIRQRFLDIWRRQRDGRWKIAVEMDNSAEAIG